MKVVAVVRTNGERTAELAARLVEEQAETHVIRVRPFTAAVRRCFELALESGADWLITVDGDTLLRPDAVQILRRYAGRAPRGVWHLLGHTRCKLYGGIRKAGTRAYRVSALPGAIPLIADAERVERSLLRAMARRRGLQSHKIPEVLSFHDYEQWFADLVRKAAVQAVKHAKQWTEKRCPEFWAASEDLDHKAALAGWYGRAWDRPEKDPLPSDWVPSWAGIDR